MATALLEKETLDLVDINELLGERPWPLPESLREYMKEIKERRVREAKEKEEALLKAATEEVKETEKAVEEEEDDEEENLGEEKKKDEKV